MATFIDRQLAGAYGSGARLYRDGPFLKGKPEHGYQLALTPREYFRAGIAATNAWTRQTYGRDFDLLNETEREAALKALEQGEALFPASAAKISSRLPAEVNRGIPKGQVGSESMRIDSPLGG